MTAVTQSPTKRAERGPQNHRTIDRVTQIVEEVVYHPGLTFAELARALKAPKSSVHGFIQGLLAAGWLHQDDNRFYLGPALMGLTLASGHLRAGSVTDADLMNLHQESGATVFLGVLAGDSLIYISEAGADLLPSFGARTNIRRRPLESAGGKALLAAMPADRRDAYLRRVGTEHPAGVEAFVTEYDDIVRTRIAHNVLHGGTQYALATVVDGPTGKPVAEVTLVGRTQDLEPRREELSKILLAHVDSWRHRSAGSQ
jgi:DNA-binding IclR family transcriptional regulator